MASPAPHASTRPRLGAPDFPARPPDRPAASRAAHAKGRTGADTPH